MKKEYTERIGLDVKLNTLSHLVCAKYNLGKFISNRVMYFGYGDFNYKLHTTTSYYVVKVINQDTAINLCESVAMRYDVAHKHGVNSPKIYKTTDDDYVLTVTPNKTCYRLFVMQYLPYNNLYAIHYQLLLHDFEQIGEQLSLINSIDYKTAYIYDSWAIQSLQGEYSKFDKSQIDDSIKKIIDATLLQLQLVDYSQLPNSFIHGDVVDMNILKSKDNFYIVDFSSANYQLRICDLATTIADMCYTTPSYQTNINALLCGYAKHIKLNKYELDMLPLFVKCAAIIGYLNCIKEQTTNGGKYNTQLLQKYIKVITIGDTNEKQTNKPY